MDKSEYVQYELLELMDNSNSLIIPNRYFNGDNTVTFNISNNGNLKRIVIGDNSFGKVRVFELNGLSELESVVIGQKSFTMNTNEPWKSERTDGSCKIVNCPKLKSIQINGYSLGDYHSFEMRNLPSLQSFTLGTLALNPVHSAVFESK